MGLLSVTGRALTTKNGVHTYVTPVGGIMEANYGHSSYQRVASCGLDLYWMKIQNFTKKKVLFEEGLQG